MVGGGGVSSLITMILKVPPDAKGLWPVNKPLKFFQLQDSDSVILSGQGNLRRLTEFPRAVALFACLLEIIRDFPLSV